MIEVEGLRKRYGRAVALDGISFRVNAGEVAGFVGLNGAGKTTAMRILCGFMPRDAGAVTVGGIDVGKDSLGARRLLGYLPEGVPLYPEMRVCLLYTSDVDDDLPCVDIGGRCINKINSYHCKPCHQYDTKFMHYRSVYNVQIS